MLTYDISGVINNVNQTEQLNTLDWFRTNYSIIITAGATDNTTREFTFTLKEPNFVNVEPIITAITVEFNVRLILWEIMYDGVVFDPNP